jgi:hypothetical protein
LFGIPTDKRARKVAFYIVLVVPEENTKLENEGELSSNGEVFRLTFPFILK